MRKSLLIILCLIASNMCFAQEKLSLKPIGQSFYQEKPIATIMHDTLFVYGEMDEVIKALDNSKEHQSFKWIKIVYQTFNRIQKPGPTILFNDYGGTDNWIPKPGSMDGLTNEPNILVKSSNWGKLTCPNGKSKRVYVDQ